MHIKGMLFKKVKSTQNDYIKNQSEEWMKAAGRNYLE